MSGEALQVMRKVRMLCMNTDDPIYTVSKSHFSMQKLFLQASSRCNVRECRPACHSFFFAVVIKKLGNYTRLSSL